MLLTVSFGVYNAFVLHQIDKKATSTAEKSLPLFLTYEKLRTNISEQVSLTRAYALFGYQIYIKDFNKLTEESNQLIEQELSDFNSEEFKQLDQQSEALTTNIRENVFDVYNAGNTGMAIQNLYSVNSQADNIVAGYSELLKAEELSMIEESRQFVSLSKSSFTIGIIISIVVTVLGVSIALLVTNIITKPIKKVSERMNLIAAGELSKEPLSVNSKDEVGQLIYSTNKMNEHLKNLLFEISTVSKSVSGQSEELTQAANEVKFGSQQASATMQELTTGAETQANITSELATSMIDFSKK
ncbi:HAMP domain-containing protein [Paraliobacillus sediminis]|uniref:HAMP domain-containing protein n=1 Tax=Paraliobacillus sediminis TaxID=1885916 RepID=UPI000E3C35D1|nr:methyl-accepting chemotaxis protein [Paraliobacillus sediminis]